MEQQQETLKHYKFSYSGNLGGMGKFKSHRAWDLDKWEKGTGELGTNIVLKQTNELCFYSKELPSAIVIG